MHAVDIPVGEPWSAGHLNVLDDPDSRRYEVTKVTGVCWSGGRYYVVASVPPYDPLNPQATTTYRVFTFGPGDATARHAGIDPTSGFGYGNGNVWARVLRPADAPYVAVTIPTLTVDDRDRRRTHLTGHFGSQYAAQMFLCAAYGVGAGKHGVAVLDPETGRHCVIVPQPHANYCCAAVAADGLTIAAVGGGANPPVVVFDNPLIG